MRFVGLTVVIESVVHAHNHHLAEPKVISHLKCRISNSEAFVDGLCDVSAKPMWRVVGADVVRECGLGHKRSVATTDEIDTVQGFDLLSRLLDDQVVHGNVILGIKNKFFKAKKYFVKPYTGVLAQKSRVHMVERWAITD